MPQSTGGYGFDPAGMHPSMVPHTAHGRPEYPWDDRSAFDDHETLLGTPTFGPGPLPSPRAMQGQPYSPGFQTGGSSYRTGGMHLIPDTGRKTVGRSEDK
ncbi:hypothetical protein FRC04_012230 [Tulasnella sp. 424]|nr:hypothetical protein FRC04_012230 [Tulasnella sp. 424]KAG8973717.1 hypothetical protein FRC05_008305 [Tulasnella sp. 425]